MNRLLITLIFLFVNVLWVFSDAYVEVKNGGFERDRIALNTGTLQHVQGSHHQFLMLTMVVTLLSQPLMVHSLEDLLGGRRNTHLALTLKQYYFIRRKISRSRRF